MKILCCGNRNWTDRKKIWDRLADIDRSAHAITIIHGAAKGADTIAGNEAKKLRYAVEAFPADWEKHGKAAGPIRNRKMLDQKPDLVIAFHSNIKKSKGTKDCIKEANRRGIKVEIIP